MSSETNQPEKTSNLELAKESRDSPDEDQKRQSRDATPIENPSKRPRVSAADDDAATEAAVVSPLDTARTLGFQAGDRIEVRWELSNEDTNPGSTESRWWGATLLEHDGRTTDDGVAIRLLDYDPCEEWGYPERSIESVIFGNEFFLINPETMDQLFYRKEGEEAVVGLDEDDLRDELNDMLMGILEKHKTLWQGLDAAKQAQIGELMANGKEAIISTIRNRFVQEGKPIAAADIPSILQEAFAELRKEE
jgi:hypothetical protein